MFSDLMADMFNYYYKFKGESDDYSLNSVGWNSSFTGQPYSSDEMYEWRNNTVDLIKTVAGERVLEAACGTGMMMFRILPDINYYVGIDVSEEGIKYIKSHLNPEDEKKTEFYVMSVEKIDTIEQDGFDLAFINSATQYMGPAEEFRNCIIKMMDKVKKGGKIFLGDIKSDAMRRKFYKLIAMWDGKCDNVEQEINIKEKNDMEFYIGRDFFDSLSDIPRIRHIDVMLRKGMAQTEMNMFRYDVIIHLDEYDEKEFFFIDCSGMDIARINDEISANSGRDFIRLGNISNKLVNDVLHEKLGEEKKDSLYAADVCAAAEKYGYETRVVPTRADSTEYFDIEAFKKG